jgi:hypothetical protein
MSCALLSAASVTGAAQALATGGCPTRADAIATDRPDVTNSSLSVSAVSKLNLKTAILDGEVVAVD